MAGTMGQASMRDLLDKELLREWRQGDQRAGEELFGRYFEPLFRFFQFKCRGNADDLVQSTLLACLRGKQQFEGRSSFRTYLYAIARHELYRQWSQGRKEREHLDYRELSLPDPATTASTKLARHRAAELTHQTMNRLPLEQQILLELHYWHDLDAGELADLYEVPRETIRSRLFRARKMLGKLLRSTPSSRSEIESFIFGKVSDSARRGLTPRL